MSLTDSRGRYPHAARRSVRTARGAATETSSNSAVTFRRLQQLGQPPHLRRLDLLPDVFPKLHHMCRKVTSQEADDGTPWNVNAGDAPFRSALEQTARNARQLSLRHGVAKHGRPEVQPVLVVWGPASQKLRELPVRRHESGVVVMSGDRLQAWMLCQPRDRLAGANVNGVFDEIDRHLSRRDQRERVSRPMPRSLGEMDRRIVTGLGLGLGAFLLTSWLLRLPESLLVWG